jgi:hypothetical protein
MLDAMVESTEHRCMTIEKGIGMVIEADHTTIFRSQLTQPTKVAGTLRRAVRSPAFARILGGRHMECAYYFDFCRLCIN